MFLTDGELQEMMRKFSSSPPSADAQFVIHEGRTAKMKHFGSGGLGGLGLGLVVRVLKVRVP